jgi:purine-binding chemotaxis protein CheW
MAASRQYCTFILDDLYFGIEVQRVQEVMRYQELTCVPLAPRVVRGLINLRGQIVPALDLRRRLELRERPDGQLPMNVVVQTWHGPASLLVDKIGDVLELTEEAFEQSPETLRGVARELLVGAYKLDTRLLLILDLDRVLSVSDAA